MFGFPILLTPWTQKDMDTKIFTTCKCGLSQNVRGLVPWWWMHLELEGQTHLMDRYQESMVGGPPCFGEIDWLYRFW